MFHSRGDRDLGVAFQTHPGSQASSPGIKDVPQPADKMDFMRTEGGEALAAALLIKGKLERQGKVTAIKEDLLKKVSEKWPEVDAVGFVHLFDALEIETVRKNVLEKGLRIDGRAQHEIRPLAA